MKIKFQYFLYSLEFKDYKISLLSRIQYNLKYINFTLVGASLGGLVIIVLVGYFIARMRNNREQAEDQERIVQ